MPEDPEDLALGPVSVSVVSLSALLFEEQKQNRALDWPRAPRSLEVGLGCALRGAPGRSRAVADLACWETMCCLAKF